jgi:hypothetical protein
MSMAFAWRNFYPQLTIAVFQLTGCIVVRHYPRTPSKRQGAFDHFAISGQSTWVAPEEAASGHTPVTADWKFDYKQDPEILTLEYAEFDTPGNRIRANGVLGHRDSLLDLHIQSSELESFNDFIQSIEEVIPGTPEEIAPHIRGAANWDGRLTGPLGQPNFNGHLRGERIVYGKVHLDTLEGDVIIRHPSCPSPAVTFRSGAMQADLEGTLDLDHWSFRPENEWTADANLEKVPVSSVLALAGESYPVEGVNRTVSRSRNTSCTRAERPFRSRMEKCMESNSIVSWPARRAARPGRHH